MSRRGRPPRRDPYPGYPNDLLPRPVTREAWEAAKLETYRFLRNQHRFRFDLQTLLASVYLQESLDGAAVQRDLGDALSPSEERTP
jgi:hypothetical protein